MTDQTQPVPVRAARIAWVDAAKGLAIILVILGHALMGVRDAGLASPDGLVSGAAYYIYVFHMAAFFFISGLFIAPRAAKGAASVFSKMPLNLLWPYVVWGCLLLAMQLAANDYISKPLEGGRIQMFLDIWRSPPGPFWYIYVLVFYQIVAFVALRLRAPPLILVLGVICFALAEALRGRINPVLYVGLHFFLFFAMGVLAGRAPQAIAKPRRFDNPIVAAVLLAAIIPCAILAKQLGWSYYSAWLLPVALAGAGGLMILARTPRISRNPWLIYVGERTLAIYVMHIFFTSGVRIVLEKLLGVTSPSVIIPLAVAAGLAGPLAIFGVADHLRLSQALGLGPSLRKRPMKPEARASA